MLIPNINAIIMAYLCTDETIEYFRNDMKTFEAHYFTTASCFVNAKHLTVLKPNSSWELCIMPNKIIILFWKACYIWQEGSIQISSRTNGDKKDLKELQPEQTPKLAASVIQYFDKTDDFNLAAKFHPVISTESNKVIQTHNCRIDWIIQSENPPLHFGAIPWL